MKKIALILCLGVIFTGFTSKPSNKVEFVCMKKHMATRTCHYNFKVDGDRYRYVDIGCKFTSRQDVIDYAVVGELALSKNWQYACQEPRYKHE